MLVIVGSKNPAKLRAVESAFKRYFKAVEVQGADVESGVGRQPLSLRETVQGAVNRAKNAWKKARGKCAYAVGMEAGLVAVKEAKTGYMDVCVAAIFDGKQVFLGFTPAFEYPKVVVEKILRNGKEVSEVFLEQWGEDTRDELGAIGRLTKGAVPRYKLHETGLLMALAQVVNKKYYG